MAFYRFFFEQNMLSYRNRYYCGTRFYFHFGILIIITGHDGKGRVIMSLGLSICSCFHNPDSYNTVGILL